VALRKMLHLILLQIMKVSGLHALADLGEWRLDANVSDLVLRTYTFRILPIVELLSLGPI
jgi:hypothetical protein